MAKLGGGAARPRIEIAVAFFRQVNYDENRRPEAARKAAGYRLPGLDAAGRRPDRHNVPIGHSASLVGPNPRLSQPTQPVMVARREPLCEACVFRQMAEQLW
jgi:hypothetical protein